jgi:LytS/YehU family sensor histidine kinase
MRKQASQAFDFSFWHYALMLFSLLLMAGIQSAYAGHLYVQGAQPDFLLTTATVIGVQTSSSIGVIAGFTAGFFTAGIGGPFAGTYIISRTIACFGALWLTESILRHKILASLVATLAASIFAGILFGLSVPSFGIMRLLKMTGFSAIMNTLLALPLSFLFSALIKKKQSFF